MRQPQAIKSASVSSADDAANTAAASRLPAGAPTCGQLVQKPRCDAGATSATMRTAPPHSPPTAKPCNNRSRTSNIGAQVPIC